MKCNEHTDNQGETVREVILQLCIAQRYAGDNKDFGIGASLLALGSMTADREALRAHIDLSLRLIQQHAAKGNGFLLNKVTDDES
jgi:hypothetical protein